MIEEVAPDFYKIEVPLQDTMLKYVNSYIVRGRPRSLIIDAGDYDDDSVHTMKDALKQLGIDLRETDFFITHYHVDHIGVALRLKSEGTAIYINEIETRMVDKLKSGAFLSDIENFFRISGFPEIDPEKIVPPFVSNVYKSDDRFPFRFLKEGDTIKAGNYRFVCLETPGHSGGHMCLYEEEKRLLLSGDHLLSDITPSIQGGNSMQNPLKGYLSSLEKINALDVGLVLPGHRSIFKNHKERIRQLKDHHNQRTKGILSILKEGSMSTYRVASQMTWNVDCDSWDSFPILHSFFATEEAYAHLVYLEDKGEIVREMEGQVAVYSLSR